MREQVLRALAEYHRRAAASGKSAAQCRGSVLASIETVVAKYPSVDDDLWLVRKYWAVVEESLDGGVEVSDQVGAPCPMSLSSFARLPCALICMCRVLECTFHAWCVLDGEGQLWNRVLSTTSLSPFAQIWLDAVQSARRCHRYDRCRVLLERGMSKVSADGVHALCDAWDALEREVGSLAEFDAASKVIAAKRAAHPVADVGAGASAGASAGAGAGATAAAKRDDKSRSTKDARGSGEADFSAGAVP